MPEQWNFLPAYIADVLFIHPWKQDKTNMPMLKRILFAVLFAVMALPLSAREQTETAFLFRFVPGRDMFYVPFGGNAGQLDSLLSELSVNMEQLRSGERYISVSSYGASASGTSTAARMAYLRCQRVKSELITRGGITEAMFLTDRHIAAPYRDSLRDVVVVTFPASVEKVAEIAGAEAAARVEAYNRKQQDGTERGHLAAAEEKPETKQAAEEKTETEYHETEQQETEQPAAEEQARLQDERAAEPAKATSCHFALRTNLLRWATLTPDLGIEWRINPSWSLLVNGSWTSWSWNDRYRRYALWEVSPEVRYYIGKENRGYIGAMYKAGSFNYKLSGTGRQGDIMGGGITGGYVLRLNKALDLDFNLGVGCIHADYERYTVIDGVRVRQGEGTKNWWGPIHAGVTLVWTIF